MTSQGEWEEELVAEWLSLKGFFVETNVGLTAPKAGGRHEADIVAVRVDKNRLLIRHIEVGILDSSLEENLTTVKGKYRPDLRNAVEEFVKERVTINGGSERVYRCEYVYTYASRKNDLREQLQKEDIELVSLDSIIVDQIPQTIAEWRKKQIDSGLLRGKDPTRVQLPRKYRLLEALDRMAELTRGR